MELVDDPILFQNYLATHDLDDNVLLASVALSRFDIIEQCILHPYHISNDGWIEALMKAACRKSFPIEIFKQLVFRSYPNDERVVRATIVAGNVPHLEFLISNQGWSWPQNSIVQAIKSQSIPMYRYCCAYSGDDDKQAGAAWAVKYGDLEMIRAIEAECGYLETSVVESAITYDVIQIFKYCVDRHYFDHPLDEESLRPEMLEYFQAHVNLCDSCSL